MYHVKIYSLSNQNTARCYKAPTKMDETKSYLLGPDFAPTSTEENTSGSLIQRGETDLHHDCSFCTY